MKTELTKGLLVGLLLVMMLIPAVGAIPADVPCPSGNAVARAKCLAAEVSGCDAQCIALIIASALASCPGGSYVSHQVTPDGSGVVLMAIPNTGNPGEVDLAYGMVLSDAPSGLPAFAWVGGVGASWSDNNIDTTSHDHLSFASSSGNIQNCVVIASGVPVGSHIEYSAYGGYVGLETSGSCTLGGEFQGGFPDSHVKVTVSCTVGITVGYSTRLETERNGAIFV